MNIVVFGGTFDPIHNGHLMVAGMVASRFATQVIFVPTGQSRLKVERSITPSADRLEMVRRAISSSSCYSLSTVETERFGSSYTVDTMRYLKRQVAPCDELYFVLGLDCLLSLPHWHEPEYLIQICRLVVVPRAGYKASDITALEEVLPGISQKVLLLNEPEVDISGSIIRERVKQRLPISHLVPQVVESYIREKKLYSSD